MRAENAICGSEASEWSDPAEFVSGEPPRQPDRPEVCIENTSDCVAPPPNTGRLRGNQGASNVATDSPKVIIKWNQGASGENVTAFKVQILNGDGEFVSHPDCDEEYAATLTDPACALSMESFWSGDFQMDQGTYITATVQAKNVKGWSQASRWNTSGAMVEKVPSMMNPPEGVRDEANNDVVLNWYAMNSPRDGGSAVTTYVLMTTTDSEGDWTTLIGSDDG